MYTKHTIKPINCNQLAYNGKREHFFSHYIPKEESPSQTINVIIHKASSDKTMSREVQQVTYNLYVNLKAKVKKGVSKISRL